MRRVGIPPPPEGGRGRRAGPQAPGEDVTHEVTRIPDPEHPPRDRSPDDPGLEPPGDAAEAEAGEAVSGGSSEPPSDPIRRRDRPIRGRFPGETFDRIPPFGAASAGTSTDDPPLIRHEGIRRLESQAPHSDLVIEKHRPRLGRGSGAGVEVDLRLRNRNREEAHAADVTVELLGKTGEVLAEETEETGRLDPQAVWTRTFPFDGPYLPHDIHSTLVVVHDG